MRHVKYNLATVARSLSLYDADIRYALNREWRRRDAQLTAGPLTTWVSCAGWAPTLGTSKVQGNAEGA